jgi:hypothetical protein
MGIGPNSRKVPSVRLNRQGLGWHGSRPSSRMRDRTSSGPHGTPQPARSAWTRGCPQVPSESSKDLIMNSLSSSRLSAVAEAGRPRHSQNPEREISSHAHIFTLGGASMLFAVVLAAFSASMNSNLSLTEARWRSTRQLFPGR